MPVLEAKRPPSKPVTTATTSDEPSGGGSMITERLMKPGNFHIELVEDAPFSGRRASVLFDHVVITPTRLNPISAFTDANILANAIYTGLITSKPSGRIIEGPGLVSWLGTSEGLGDLLTANVDFAAATLTTVVNTLRPASLAAGTVTNTSTHTASYWMVTPREALDAACTAVGAEYIVQPDFTLDAGPTSALFVTTPTVVVTKKPEGRDGTYIGLDGGLIVTSTDVTQFTTQGIGVAGGEGDGLITLAGTNYGAGSYKDGLNNAVVMQRLVNVPEINDTTAATAITNAVAAAWNDPRYGLEVTTTSPIPRHYAKPGDYIYVHDLYEQLQDGANQITFRGERIAPIKLRVTAMTWPIERGMGVYVRRSGAPPVYTDLTPWVQWEQAETRWEVALTAPVSNVHVDPAKAGKVGYLGANAEASARATPTPWIAYTPTTVGITIGNGTLIGAYRIIGSTVHFRAKFTLGSTSAITGGIQLGLPVTAITTHPMHLTALFGDVGTAVFPAICDPTTTVVNLYPANASGTWLQSGTASATVPFTWTTNDLIALSGTYEAA